MKLEIDGLTLVEAKVLIDVLAAFRAGQPFSHPGQQPAQPQLVKDPKQPTS